jgi:hypothetical protein
MTVNLEKYFSLNQTERRIVRTAAKMEPTPSTLSIFRLYFPNVADDDLRSEKPQREFF